VKAKEQITAAVICECRDVTRNVGLNYTIIRDIHPIL
jgi:hypothetical protein